MSNIMEALGATLLTGSQMAGRSRLEKRQEELDARNAEMEAVRMAILKGQEQDRILGQKRQRGLDALSAGPNAMLDPESAEAVKAAGFGARLGPQFETRAGIDPVLGTPAEIQTTGQRILPTTVEQMQIDADSRSKELFGYQVGGLKAEAGEREKQTAIRNYISTPEFWKNSPEKRQLSWAQAGYSGQAPMQEQELKDRLSFEHNLRMQEINAQGQNAINAAGVRAEAASDRSAFSEVMRLRTAYVKETETAREVSRQYGLMQEGLKSLASGSWNPGSQAVLVTFQKILDPDSVVRESEYARSPQGLAMIQRLEGLMARIQQGGPGVPPQELQRFASLANQFVEQSNRSAAMVRENVERIAQWRGLDPSLITGMSNVGGAGGVTPPAAPGTQPPAGNQSPAAPGGKFTIVGVK